MNFYDLPESAQDDLLVFHSKANRVDSRNAGFSGNIVTLDNGANVFPRWIAAKFPKLKNNFGPDEVARRFVREMKLQAGMHYHSNVHWPFNVVFVLGAPIAFFRKWLGDLSNFIERPDIGDEARLSILVQVLAGLRHCRERAVICHQDLKPENIFIRDLQNVVRGLTDDDLPLVPLIADFGSVNLFAEKGVFGGSRPYMAPEQWDKTQLTEQTSVFAVGVILHELMSRGEHPCGEHGGDWHRGVNPAFNRWQDSDRWRRWRKAGCPIRSPLADERLASIVSRCLDSVQSGRPDLQEVQTLLLGALREISPHAAARVEWHLAVWRSHSSDPEWEHLNRRITQLEAAVLEHYGPDIDTPLPNR
jgi:serine/threonine protein kinase